jgi:hypothetical protein
MNNTPKNTTKRRRKQSEYQTKSKKSLHDDDFSAPVLFFYGMMFFMAVVFTYLFITCQIERYENDIGSQMDLIQKCRQESCIYKIIMMIVKLLVSFYEYILQVVYDFWFKIVVPFWEWVMHHI